MFMLIFIFIFISLNPLDDSMHWQICSFLACHDATPIHYINMPNQYEVECTICTILTAQTFANTHDPKHVDWCKLYTYVPTYHCSYHLQLKVITVILYDFLSFQSRMPPHWNLECSLYHIWTYHLTRNQPRQAPNWGLASYLLNDHTMTWHL